MSELSEKAMRLMVASHTMNNFDMWKTLYDYIAGLEDENCSLGESNLWLKQNYENLERDYGVMHGKMCLRIDELRARIAELEGLVERLIEISDWATIGMVISESYSPSSNMRKLAEDRRNEWEILVKEWKEREK